MRGTGGGEGGGGERAPSTSPSWSPYSCHRRAGSRTPRGAAYLIADQDVVCSLSCSCLIVVGARVACSLENGVRRGGGRKLRR